MKSSGDDFIAVVYDKHSKHLCVMKQRALRSLELYKRLEFENDDNAIAIDLATVKAGQSVDIDIPIANKPALTSDNYGQMTITLEADGEEIPILIRDISVDF